MTYQEIFTTEPHPTVEVVKVKTGRHELHAPSCRCTARKDVEVVGEGPTMTGEESRLACVEGQKRETRVHECVWVAAAVHARKTVSAA